MIAPVHDLTLPASGSKTAQLVLGNRLKRTLHDFFNIPLGRFRAQVFDDFADVRAIVKRLLADRKAGLVFSIMRRPSHSTLVDCLYQELWGGGDVTKLDTWLIELTALLALDLSAHGELPEDGILLRNKPTRLNSIAGGFVLEVEESWRLGFKPGRIVLEKEGERAEVPFEKLVRGDGPWPAGLQLSRPFAPIVPGVQLAWTDNNPLADFEAHPDKFGNAIDLGGQSPERWAEVIQEGVALIDVHLPDLGREFRQVMQTLVPVGFDEEKHLSASYREVIGSFYLTLHPDLMTMTEALIHEFSHNKLNALWGLDPVLINAYEPLFKSPVRPDPRPLHGIVLAVHAFIPVARLYQLMLEADHPLAKPAHFKERFKKIIQGNHDGYVTLHENAKPTPVGQALLDELGKWDEHFMKLSTTMEG